MTDLNREYAILLDKSGSMGQAGKSGKTLWEEAQEGTLALATKVAKLDDNGIDVGFFNNAVKIHEGVGPDKVKEIFNEHDPFGGTATDVALQEVVNRWEKNAKKPTTVIVVTDGEPNDKKALEKVIIDTTKKMDADEQLAISFLQIGTDVGAQKFLQSLDDDLEKQGAKFDIVDTKTFEEIEKSGMTMAEVLTAAIND